MLFLNDNKNHEWSYACLMTHTFALEPEELTAEMRQTIGQAAEVVSVNLRGAYIYKSAADDDIDCFVLHSPAGYIMVMSSEAAKLNLETLAFILAEADHDAAQFGPEIEYDCSAAYSKGQKRKQEARKPVGV